MSYFFCEMKLEFMRLEINSAQKFKPNFSSKSIKKRCFMEHIEIYNIEHRHIIVWYEYVWQIDGTEYGMPHYMQNRDNSIHYFCSTCVQFPKDQWNKLIEQNVVHIVKSESMMHRLVHGVGRINRIGGGIKCGTHRMNNVYNKYRYVALIKITSIFWIYLTKIIHCIKTSFVPCCFIFLFSLTLAF